MKFLKDGNYVVAYDGSVSIRLPMAMINSIIAELADGNKYPSAISKSKKRGIFSLEETIGIKVYRSLLGGCRVCIYIDRDEKDLIEIISSFNSFIEAANNLFAAEEK